MLRKIGLITLELKKKDLRTEVYKEIHEVVLKGDVEGIVFFFFNCEPLVYD